MVRRRPPHVSLGQTNVVVRHRRRAQPGVPAERLNQGDFGRQTRQMARPIHARDPVQPPAELFRWAAAYHALLRPIPYALAAYPFA
jgi:hypothetical protein